VSRLVLAPIAAPPVDRIVGPGAQFVTVTSRGVSPPHSHPALLIAWARLPGGDWACLMVWDGARRDAQGHDSGSARWSWVRFVPGSVGWQRPWPDQPTGLRWFGRPHGSPMEAAFAEAVESLPPSMRQVAAAHTPEVGPPE
jgi:hypothetical protein